ncbi:hypothetical protein TcasGA2_TC033940 [Tribolium castaneum]|uniref:Uncharacterized protein n=1 Tax=Tribolium castaneum TaxID=7070 RepID=A0A139WDP2_TRICA|nr:hypothetical protein TcasGA2_TC033940 [Tribolium castaneum]
MENNLPNYYINNYDPEPLIVDEPSASTNLEDPSGSENNEIKIIFMHRMFGKNLELKL